MLGTVGKLKRTKWSVFPLPFVMMAEVAAQPFGENGRLAQTANEDPPSQRAALTLLSEWCETETSASLSNTGSVAIIRLRYRRAPLARGRRLLGQVVGRQESFSAAGGSTA